MDRAFAVSLLILILVIYSIVPWNRSECFTDTTAPPILYTCPNGGTLKSDGKTCSDRTVDRTYTCPSDLRFERHGDMPRCCNDSTCYFTPDNGTCPKGFDKKDKKCYRSEYEAKKSCPEFYKLDGKGKNCVPVDLEERFTDKTPPSQVIPTGSCPNGGTIDGKKLCSDRVPGTYGCSVGYTKGSDGLCYNHDATSEHVQGYNCPSKYDYDYDTNNGTCVRKYGKPTLLCPQGYALTMVPNKGYICNKQ